MCTLVCVLKTKLTLKQLVVEVCEIVSAERYKPLSKINMIKTSLEALNLVGSTPESASLTGAL